MNARNSIFAVICVIGMIVINHNAHGYDRMGSDIDSKLVSTPTDCAALCDGNSACQAWTFVKPPIKHPTSAVCFLKNAVPVPEFNSTCPSNVECLSGVKVAARQWCGESPKVTVSGVLMGQGEVVSCGSGLACKSLVPSPTQRPWYCLFLPFLDACKQVKIQTLDYYCQP